MKSAALILVGLLIVGTVVATLWWRHERQAPSPSPAVIAASLAQANQPAPAAIRTTAVAEWREYHADREKVLHDHPELAAEYKELLSEIEAQRQKLDAAMIRADPKVAPTVAKLEAIQKKNVALARASETQSAPHE